MDFSWEYLQTQLLANGDSDRFQSAHVVYSTCLAYCPKQLIFNLLGGGGVVSGGVAPLRSGVLIGETVPSETSHTSESPLFDPSEKTKCYGPWKGMALWNIWRSHECGDFCAWRGGLGVFEKPGRYC